MVSYVAPPPPPSYPYTRWVLFEYACSCYDHFPYTDIFSFLFQARNRTLALLGKIDQINELVLDKVVSGDDPVKVNTRFFNLTVQKTLLEDLGGTAVSNGETKFILPSLENMRMSFGDNGTEKYSSVDVQVRFFVRIEHDKRT